MSISTAFGNAVSGLGVSSRLAETLSLNLSNAMTEGYARQQIEIVTKVVDGSGKGVTIAGVERAEDRVATMTRRNMQATNGHMQVLARASNDISQALGSPGEFGALALMFGELESALISASNAPQNQAMLRNIADRASDIAVRFNGLSATAASMRQDADADIASSVQRLNNTLAAIEELNGEISRRYISRADATGLETERQRLIDDIADLMPIKTIQREFGKVALFTKEGGVLLDHFRTEFAFTQTPMITHGMSVAAGDLSRLVVNNVPVTAADGVGVFSGGKLEALFQLRDARLPEFNAQLDGLARDLVERFQDPAVDPTLAVGDPGLLTDNGAAFVAANEIGLAGRVALNSAVAGGFSDLWKLRDGLNAVAPGDVGNNAVLKNLQDAMQDVRAGPASLGLAMSMSASDFAAEISSVRALEWAGDDARSSYTSGQLASLREAEQARIGVDSDEQLAQLMEVEKAYAANARVISALDAMLAELMEL